MITPSLDHLWLGSESSLSEFTNNLKLAETMKLSAMDEDEEENPVTYDIVGNVGILNISGTTIAKHSWITKLFGMVSYGDIKDKLLEVAEDNTKVIILNIDSNGGIAKGVADLSEFISTYSNNVKEIVTFTSGDMCSAAYWYGSSASKVVSANNADIGSIGVIAVHTEYSKMLEKNGITATVFRSAPFKALGQKEEPISEKFKTHINQLLEKMHASFVNGIALNRGIDSKFVSEKIASGKTFDPAEALELKMIDSIMSFEQLIAKLDSAFDNSSVY